jgi:hypothetical protein
VLAKLKRMKSKPVDTMSTGESLTLPEPDPDNITVLTRNLPNTPIIPWNHYDSPWREGQEEGAEEVEGETTPNTDSSANPEIQNLDSIAEQSEDLGSAEAIANWVEESNQQEENESREQPDKAESLEETPTDELTG